MRSENQHYKRAPRIASRQVNNQTVLVLAATGEVLVINAPGAHLWELLEHGCTVEQAAASLVDSFEITLDQAIIDARSFLESLCTKGAVLSK